MAKNHNRLRGKIREVFGTQDIYAEKMGISTTSASKKLSGESQFKQCEIKKTVEILSIPVDEVWDYFFNE